MHGVSDQEGEALSVTGALGTAIGFTPDPRVLVGAVPLHGYEHHTHERALSEFALAHRTRLRTGLEVDVVTMGLEDTRDLLGGTGRWPVLSNDATALRAAMRAKGWTQVTSSARSTATSRNTGCCTNWSHPVSPAPGSRRCVPVCSI
jgi:hypothetical protein